MPTKKSLMPFIGKAKLSVHAGKGSVQTTGQKPSRTDVAQLTGGNAPQNSMNDYAKQDPMASDVPPGLPGLDTGNFSGVT